MHRLSVLLAAAFVFAAFPSESHAQSRTDDGWWGWAAGSDRADGSIRSAPDRRDNRRDARDDRYERRDDRYDDRYERRDDRRNDKGPKFCRNGQGHPTKGMRWCYEKGFATPRYDRRINRRVDRRIDRREARWERRTIEDIIFGTPRSDRDRRRATLDQRVLGEVLGRSTMRDLGSVASGPIVGRWVRPSRDVRVLQLRDSRGPLAELTDYDADGRVDLVLVNSLR